MTWQEIERMRLGADAAREYQEKLDDQSKRISELDFTAIADLLFSVRRDKGIDPYSPAQDQAEWNSVKWPEFSKHTGSLKYRYWMKASKLVQEMWEAGVSRDQIGNAILVSAKYL